MNRLEALAKARQAKAAKREPAPRKHVSETAADRRNYLRKQAGWPTAKE